MIILGNFADPPMGRRAEFFKYFSYMYCGGKNLNHTLYTLLLVKIRNYILEGDDRVLCVVFEETHQKRKEEAEIAVSIRCVFLIEKFKLCADYFYSVCKSEPPH